MLRNNSYAGYYAVCVNSLWLASGQNDSNISGYLSHVSHICQTFLPFYYPSIYNVSFSVS
jgi:hypothetical protein